MLTPESEVAHEQEYNLVSQLLVSKRVAKLGSVPACIQCACRGTLDGTVRGEKPGCGERMAPGRGTEADF